MMEKVNISQALNNLSVKDDADFFYGETSSKPVKIKKSNLFTSVFAYKGLLSSDKDLNTTFRKWNILFCLCNEFARKHIGAIVALRGKGYGFPNSNKFTKWGVIYSFASI